MSNNNTNTKKTIFCVHGIIILLLMEAHLTALGQTKTEAPNRIEPEVLERELIETLDSVYREIKDDQKNMNVGVLVPQTSTVLPPDPDNAALLYYQAMLYRPQPDVDTEELIYKVLRGAEPDEKLRAYLNQQSCRKTIKLAEAAARIQECNWGILRSEGFGFNSLAFRHLYFLLEVNARTLAADGNYRSALGRCLTLFRLAKHVHRMFISSLAVDRRAFESIRYILGSMPPDADILIWLQGQLAIVSGASISCAEMLETDFEFVLGIVRKEPDTLAGAREHLEKKAKDDITKKEIQGLTDDELLARARQSYAKFLNSVLRVIGSGMPYEKTYAEIQRLIDKLEEQANSDPVIILWPCVLVIDNMYELQVRHTAEFNALKAAIEIYLVKAKTGQFPEKLPDGLPKDPYTGGDFKYEITDEGFALRCHSEEFQKGRLKQMLEFKLKISN